MKRNACIILFVGVAANASAQQPVLPERVRAAAGAIEGERIHRDASYLASDALLGRATPSPGLDSATAFVVERLRRLGLRPAGEDRTFLQRYTVLRQSLDTASTFLEVGGGRIEFGRDLFVRFFGDSTPVTAPMVYVGHGLRVPNRNMDAFANVDVRGKIVIAHADAALLNNRAIPALGAVNVDWFRVWDSAKERGAVGLILIPAADVLRTWEQLQRRPSFRQSNELTPPVRNAYELNTLPTVVLRWERLAQLFAGESVEPVELLARAEAGDFLPPFELTARATLRVGIAQAERIRPANIVAMIEGSDRALRREAVVLMAHLDGAVGTATVNGDSIYNAADDNASGSAALLAIAEAMMRAPRPKRSVIFLWDTGEEVGLWGSRWFAANPVVPLSDIVAYYNIDMLGRSRQPGSSVRGEEELTGPDEIYLTGPRVLSSDADSIFARVNRELHNLNFNRAYDVATHQRFYPRNDGAPLLERGVLVIKIQDGEQNDYHTPTDEAHKLDPQKMEKVSRTIFGTAWVIANSAERPRMDKGIPPNVPRF